MTTHPHNTGHNRRHWRPMRSRMAYLKEIIFTSYQAPWKATQFSSGHTRQRDHWWTHKSSCRQDSSHLPPRKLSSNSPSPILYVKGPERPWFTKISRGRRPQTYNRRSPSALTIGKKVLFTPYLCRFVRRVRKSPSDPLVVLTDAIPGNFNTRPNTGLEKIQLKTPNINPI